MKSGITICALLLSSVIYSQEITTISRNNPSEYQSTDPSTNVITPFKSGFFQANVPQNFPNLGHESGQWRHLIDVRHDNPKFAMQLSGYYWDQNLWFRKIGEGFLNQTWSRILTEDSAGTINLKNRYNNSDAGNRIQFGSLGEDSFGPFIRSSLSNASGSTTKMALKLGSYWEGEKNELTLINSKVGINTSLPSRTLTVNGDIFALGASSMSFQDDARFLVSKSQVPTLSPASISMPHYGFLAPNAGGSAELWIAGNAGIRMFTGGDANPKFNIATFGNASLHGKFEATEIKVTQSPTADFVFEENYGLPELEDVEMYIKNNKHLPEVASAKKMEKEGVNVGEFQIKLLQKIEELTLYSIKQNKKIKQLEEKNYNLQNQIGKINDLEKEIKEMKTLFENLRISAK